jgi:hypothetical protein
MKHVEYLDLFLKNVLASVLSAFCSTFVNVKSLRLLVSKNYESDLHKVKPIHSDHLRNSDNVNLSQIPLGEAAAEPHFIKNMLSVELSVLWYLWL